MSRPSARKKPTSWFRRVAWAASAAAVVAVAWLALRPPAALVIDVLDVGQGDAALLRRGREEILIDGGPDASVLTGLGESLPLLDRRIETVIVTHPHADHFIGVIHVLERYEVGLLLYTASDGAPEWKRLMASAASRGVPTKKIAAGWETAFGDHRLAALWPPPDFVSPEDDLNDYSAVIAVRQAAGDRAAALLMGDATPLVEAALLASAAVPRAELLKAAHHGSRFSTTTAFLKAAAPKLAAVSVGKNSFGHPTWAALERLRRAGTRVLRTDKSGHVRVAWRNGVPRVTTGPLATLPPVR